jgi:hypothetical protein
MNQPSEDIKLWAARRKAAAIMEIIKGNNTAPEYRGPTLPTQVLP